MKIYTFSREVVLYASVPAGNEEEAFRKLEKMSRNWDRKLAEHNIIIDTQSDWECTECEEE